MKYDLEKECKKAVELLKIKYKINAEYIIAFDTKRFSRTITIVTREFDYLIILSHIHQENMSAQEIVDQFISAFNGLTT